MRVIDLITFLRGEVDYQYVPNKFPTSAGYPDKAAAVVIHPGRPVDEWTGKRQPSFQILVRGGPNGDADAEAKAYEIFDTLANRRDVNIGADSLSIITPVGSAPFYIGEDEIYRPIYSMNFNAVIRPAPQT
ncbi:minor capsid protein [Alteribacter populi]|uniref:minor capsid protein n=1 Tax=Alteribacter populi TaxID=2011011 RepID=UPI000BBB29D6|nr:minor capsid protein [Alteribacter populi]